VCLKSLRNQMNLKYLRWLIDPKNLLDRRYQKSLKYQMYLRWLIDLNCL